MTQRPVGICLPSFVVPSGSAGGAPASNDWRANDALENTGSFELPSGSAGDPPAPADGRGRRSRGYLPHFDEPGTYQMITFRLADSLPLDALDAALAITNQTARRSRVESLLDAGHGRCDLSNPIVAEIVLSTLQGFDGRRYGLIAWVITPNHVHVLIQTRSGYGLAAVVQNWKSYTSKAANRVLGRSGRFWQAEYFDRAIRDDRHLRGAVEYIHANPVKAQLVSRPEDWAFSSSTAAGPSVGAGESPALPADLRWGVQRKDTRCE